MHSLPCSIYLVVEGGRHVLVFALPFSNYLCIFSSRLEHMKMHELHRGHESMHAEMVLILFVTLIVSQIGLVKWRQISPQSYHVSTAEICDCLSTAVH